MSSHTPPPVTLLQLQRFGGALRAIVQLADEYRAKAFVDDGHHWYEPHSPADLESTQAPLERHIHDLLGYANVRMAGALELSDFVGSMASDAGIGKPTHIYAPLTAARAAIEMCSVVAWLMEPLPDPLTRVARLLTLERSEQKGLDRLIAGMSERTLQEIDSDADHLGLPKIGRGNRSGYLHELPPIGSLVGDLLGAPWVYSLLSSVSHGETPGLIYFGYAESARRDEFGPVLEKRPPALGLAFAASQVLEALGRATSFDAAYRGWDETTFRTDAQSALRANGLSVEAIKWPNAA